MELEALGAIKGQVLDIGCGLGDNAIYLASRGHSVTGLDSSPAGIEQARARAADAGVQVRFDVADATELAGYDGAFDTVVDSALYHCLDRTGRQAYAAALHRATTPGARLFIYCFSDDSVNGVTAPMDAVQESEIRETLPGGGWRIDFLGPTTFLGNASGFSGSFGKLPDKVLAQMPPELAQDAHHGRKNGRHPAPHRRRPHPPALPHRPRHPDRLNDDRINPTATPAQFVTVT